MIFSIVKLSSKAGSDEGLGKVVEVALELALVVAVPEIVAIEVLEQEDVEVAVEEEDIVALGEAVSLDVEEVDFVALEEDVEVAVEEADIVALEL